MGKTRVIINQIGILIALISFTLPWGIDIVDRKLIGYQFINISSSLSIVFISCIILFISNFITNKLKRFHYNTILLTICFISLWIVLTILSDNIKSLSYGYFINILGLVIIIINEIVILNSHTIKTVKNPENLFPMIIDDLKSVLDNKLLSVVLYGSIMRNEFDYVKSDINLLIIISDTEVAILDKIQPIIKKYKNKGLTNPLILSKDYIEKSTDTFPLEFIDIKSAYKVLYGEDIISNLEINPHYIRLECEREIKSKLLSLNHSILYISENHQLTREKSERSFTKLSAIFRGLLFIKNIEAPIGKNDCILEGVENYKLDKTIFNEFIDIHNTKKKLKKSEWHILFDRYITEIEKLSEMIDEMGVLT